MSSASYFPIEPLPVPFLTRARQISFARGTRIQIGDLYVHRRFLILHGRTLYLIIEILKELFYRFSCLDSDIAAGRMGTHHILIGNKSLDRALIQLFDQDSVPF